MSLLLIYLLVRLSVISMIDRAIACILPGPSAVVSANSQHYTKELCCVHTI